MIDWNHPGLRFCHQIFATAEALRGLAFAEMLKKGANLTMRQVIAVKEMSVMLKEHPDGVTLKELSTRLELTPGTVSELVETLVQRGIFDRAVNAADRRKVRIRLSDDYYRKLEEGLARMQDIAMKALDGVKAADRGKLSRLLDAVQNGLDNIRIAKEV
ncbi:MAG: MarR family transcriptional regulator [Planctomycetes bacterium]|nr:MarR family transcriptional regulator [Planctomycetota bacterium]